MRQEVQWYLVEALATARATRNTPHFETSYRTITASFSGQLSALLYVDELTEEERLDWEERMRLALGISTNRVILRVANNSNLAHPATGASGKNTFPLFVRSIPGPDAEFEVYGGRLRIMAVEIYDTMVSLRYRSAPEPDVSAAFPDEAAQLDRDVEGTEPWAAEHLRNKAQQRLRAFRLYDFSLEDNVGTEYFGSGGGRRGGPCGTTGEADFIPAPPANASTITVKWLSVRVDVALS